MDRIKKFLYVLGTAVIFISPFYLLRMLMNTLVYGQYVVHESNIVVLLIEVVVLFYGTLFVSYKMIKSVKESVE